MPLRREECLVNKKPTLGCCAKKAWHSGGERQVDESVKVRGARPPTGQTKESCVMEFMAAQLVGGQRFRLLTLVDNHGRESLAIETGQRSTRSGVGAGDFASR